MQARTHILCFGLILTFLPDVLPPLSALGQIMLYVDGMNGVIGHVETIQWLYTLVGSKVNTPNCAHLEKKTQRALFTRAQ